MAKGKKDEEVVIERNTVTVHRDYDDEGNIKAWYTLSEGYDGPDVTVDVDPLYAGGDFDVPPDQNDHVYVLQGPLNAGVWIPAESGVLVRVNCGAGGGPP